MENIVYRVTEDGTEKRYGGYRNDTKLFNTLKGARQARNDAVRHQEANKRYRERTGKEPIEYGRIKIQKSALVWEDVE
jgi:hypothetical protein